MELLEGETLTSRLTRGPLPIDEAIRYAVQVASALDRAHQVGIVHRDLKPGNIFLVPSDGTSPALVAKLLDFGIAKQQAESARERAPAGPSTELETVASDLTTHGAILGTAQYMAPEQIEGGPIDARTDVFSFGSVLFEMLTGRKAFEGSSRVAVIGAILSHDPPAVATLQPSVPQWLDNVVKRCLAKKPAK